MAAELYYGARASNREEENLARLNQLLGIIPITHNTKDFQHITDLKIEDWFVVSSGDDPPEPHPQSLP